MLRRRHNTCSSDGNNLCHPFVYSVVGLFSDDNAKNEPQNEERKSKYYFQFKQRSNSIKGQKA